MAPARRTARLMTAMAVVAVAALGLSGCTASSASSSSSAAPKSTVNIVAYSVPQPAYDALESAFKKTPAGAGVSFRASYGPSGSQSKAVIAGQKADYVAFSVEPDLTNLVPAKVDPGWKSNTTKGMVANSVVVLVVRKGNPKHITGWDDLTKPGVKIVTPDPASSGSAKWNILAAYQHVISEGGTQTQATAYLKAFFGNTVSRAASGAAAMTQFLNGTGDVVVSYENEAIEARQAGNAVQYIVPKQTMLIQNPAAATKTAPKAAKDFLSFVTSDKGQEVFASKGFRPVVSGVKVGTVAGANDPKNPFPTPAKLTTIADLGGWSAVNTKFFDPTSGLVTTIEAGS